jgi:hypothetical protein
MQHYIYNGIYLLLLHDCNFNSEKWIKKLVSEIAGEDIGHIIIISNFIINIVVISIAVVLLVRPRAYPIDISTRTGSQIFGKAIKACKG